MDEKRAELKTQRRNRKGAMTRSLNTLQSVLDKGDADVESVKELMKKSEEAFDAVEAAHQAFAELLDDEAFDTEEAWMAQCQEGFWKVRNAARKYLTDKVSNDNKVTSSDKTNSMDISGLRELKLALELPKAEVVNFNGDPVNYWTFLTNFETNVASKLSNDKTKLQYLLQLCKGKARVCIESCALLDSGGYERALEILKKQFGQPHVVLNALMSNLLKRKQIGTGDGESLWALIGAMKNCQITLTQMGYTSDLNSTSNLLKVQALLPMYMQGKWANKAQETLKDREPTFLDLLTFVESQAEVCCNMFGRSVGKVKEREDVRPKVRANVVKTDKGLSCYVCDNDHRVYHCSTFEQMTYSERVKKAKARRLCFRCLVPGHVIANCRRRIVCNTCKSDRHHELLHPPDHTLKKEENSVVTSCATSGMGKVYLMIVPVTVTAKNGTTVKTMALLDNGSDASLCNDALRRKLGATGRRVRYTASTVNGDEEKQGFALEITVRGSKEERNLSVKFLTVNKIPASTEAFPTQQELQHWKHLQNLPCDYDQCCSIELLIGADIPDAFWCLEERHGRPEDPYAIRTPLGWSVMGPASAASSAKHFNRISISCTNEQLLDQLKRSWAVENSGLNGEGDSVEDSRARRIMDSTTSLNLDGHYEMGLLWKHDDHKLPYNKPLAESRLASLKRRLVRDEGMREKYAETIESYIKKGYAEPVENKVAEPGNVWYLPHHPVVHPHKDKIRVVFDCAARWRNVSLNDHLLRGPDVINNLVGVLLRFRQERIALVADIEAMFHQVKVIPSDRDVLRFLWWTGGDIEKTPREYRMTAHLFGATSSPGCAGQALKRTADDNQKDNVDVVGRRAIEIIQSGFYVDDCLTSVNDTGSAVELVRRLKSILDKGGFRLTKWVSNAREVLNSVPESERAKTALVNLDELPTVRTLGVAWEAETDAFKFEVTPKEKPITRRGLLSVTSSIYDPLGFAAPFVLVAKSLLQAVCRRGVDWDEALEDKDCEIWERWLQCVPNLKSVRIPRWMRLEEAIKIQPHIFCDASEKGYAAVAYFRTVSRHDVIAVTFVIGKAKVSPIKNVSIPRLELMAAVLAVNLDSIIRKEIEQRFTLGETTFWSDSMIVLGYIKNETKRFKTFVANRVTRIRELSEPRQWRHVGTKENPADEGSRGVLCMSKWMSGPDFLTSAENQWPTTQCADISGDPEVKLSILAHLTNEVEPSNTILQELTAKYSSWNKLVRVFGWVLRFVNRARGGKPTKENRRNLTVLEIKESERSIIAWLQKIEFKAWRRDKRLTKLSPVLMGNLLRVGGRLDRSRICEDAKHPVILPSKGDVVKLIIAHHHEAVGHGGWASTLNSIRERFWLMKGRTAVKSALRGCVVCKRYLARPAQQLMAELPQERVDDSKPPFTFVGVDYFGPINIKQGRSIVKRYGCIFTCLVTRAVHLEVSKSLDSDSFINALRRFMARRGEPEKIFSDNGTNFHGAERELREELKSLNNDRLERFCHIKGFEWHFNPPSASHFGGTWERLIRSVRRIMHGVLRQQTVCEEVLTTTLTEVESILNSRPLTDISLDSRDAEPLTPNHLLLMRKGPAAPVGQVEKTSSYGRKRWLQVQYLASLFWSRWRREYLPLLQRRHKWTTPRDDMRVNDIVLLIDENSPHGRWPLGRVLITHKSRDGRVRSVDVKVGDSILKRPIVKLCIVHRNIK